MFQAVLRARPFDSEEECLDAVLHHKVEKGDAVFIRYEGPQGSGMPEMFYTSEAISSDKELGRSIVLGLAENRELSGRSVEIRWANAPYAQHSYALPTTGHLPQARSASDGVIHIPQARCPS